MKISILSTVVLLASAGQIAACKNQGDAVESTPSDTLQAVFQIAADTVPCTQGGLIGQSEQMRCLVVNGETFYDSIEGYDHQEGVGRTLKIERTQICDPEVFNSCPQDIGSIYRYCFLKVISVGEPIVDRSSRPNAIAPESR